MEVTLFFSQRLFQCLWLSKAENPLSFSFSGKRSLKDLVESLGIPHVEIESVMVNDQSRDLSSHVNPGDVIVLNSDNGQGGRQFVGQDDLRFVADVHLGKLTRWLRLLGLDVDYQNNRHDRELALLAKKEKRILLSRDRHLLMRNEVTWGILILEQYADTQVDEVLGRLGKGIGLNPFSRCLMCNGDLKEISPTAVGILSDIPVRVKKWCRDFKQCLSCGQVFWPGSHYQKLDKWCRKVVAKMAII